MRLCLVVYSFATLSSTCSLLPPPVRSPADIVSTPPEAIWTADAALCMWAILHFSAQPLASDALPRTVISWSENAQVQLWVQEGGGISVQGLGNVAHLSTSAVLNAMASRLDTLSWGVAAQYGQILLGLQLDT